MPKYQNESKVIRIEAEFSDDSNQRVSQQKIYTIAEGGVLVELFPESGKLKPGIDNRILLIASKLDGTPLKTSIYMTGEKLREFATNEFGIATFNFRPTDSSDISRFTLNVRDEKGSTLIKNFELANEVNDAGHLILRPSKTIVSGGEDFSIEVVSTNNVETRLEFFQSGKIVFSDAVKLENGTASKKIDLPKGLFGTIDIRAMQVFYDRSQNRDAVFSGRRVADQANNIKIVSDSKFILVDQDNNLSIDIEKDKESYRPGEEANITFTVKNSAGEAENSALGVKIIDEALLSMSADDSFSRLLILVNDDISKNAKAVNGLDWQTVINDNTMETRDQILSTMFLDVPREQASLSETKKENQASWEIFEAKKLDKLESFVILLFSAFVFLNIKLWWRLNDAAINKKVAIRLWGGVLLVAILITFVVVNFSGGAYYSILEMINDFSYTYLVILFLLSLASLLAWYYRVWLKAYWSIAQSLLFILGCTFIFSLLNHFKLGVTYDIWLICLYFSLLSVFVGFFSLMAIFYLNKNAFTIASYLYMIAAGISLCLISPVIIPLYVALIIFSVIQGSRLEDDNNEPEDIADKIGRLKEQLAAQGRSEKEIELEIELLKRDIQDGAFSGAFSRLFVSGALLIAWIILIITLYYIAVSATNFLPRQDLVFSQNRMMEDELGLSSADPRELISNTINIITALAILFSSASIIYGATKWLKNQRVREKRKRYRMFIINGLIGIIICLVIVTVSQLALEALYSSTGSIGSVSNSGWEKTSQDRVPSSNDPNDLLWGNQEVSIESGLELGTADSSFDLPDIVSGLVNDREGGFSGNNSEQVTESEIVIDTQDKQEKTDYKKTERVRKFFPETMLWQTELIAVDGKANIKIPVNDSITRWKLSALANSLNGKIGSGEGSLITFQDFFLDFSLPYNLTRGDELVLPVTVYNYLPTSQTVKLSVQESGWFSLLSSNNQILNLGASETKTINLKIRIEQFGEFVLRIDAEGTKLSDAVEKKLSVLPFGQRTTQTVASEEFSEDKEEFQALFPSDTIVGTEKVLVKLYPSVLSEIIAGLDNILRFPSGCFEQTSSSLYPNILVLKYLQNSGHDDREIRKKAEGFINEGVQRLLTYEIEPGGFSYFGSPPTETILTAYGLMEFSEMRDVVFVDEDLIKRTKDYLYKKQNYDGSFEITGYHNGGFSGDDELVRNAYIIWALSESDAKDDRLENSIDYLENNLAEIKKSPYTLALALNAFINYDKNRSVVEDTLTTLKQMIKVNEKNQAFIQLDRPNHYGSYGRYGNVELTALATIAFSRRGEFDFSNKLKDFIIASRDGQGTWGSTQATILALKAIVADEIATKKAKNNEGIIKIKFNGQDEKTISITPENSEVLQVVEFKNNLSRENIITIEKSGKVTVTLQIVKDYYSEWRGNKSEKANALFVDTRYGTSRKFGTERMIAEFGVGEQASLYVNLASTEEIKNLVAEVPIPAGFIVNTAEMDCQILNTQADSNCPASYGYYDEKVNYYEYKGDRVILYFNYFTSHASKTLEIPIIPQYAGKYKIMPVRFYAYYDPGQEIFSNAIGEINVGQNFIIGEPKQGNK
jgi:hypothetical protein